MGDIHRPFGSQKLAIASTPYTVSYIEHQELIDILRVLHGRRNIPDAWHSNN